jgi:hypothetical protein
MTSYLGLGKTSNPSTRHKAPLVISDDSENYCRGTVVQYKGAKKPLPQIAQELNVDAVVEATVLPSGNRVRLPHSCLTRGPTASRSPRVTSATGERLSGWRNRRRWQSLTKSAGG